ncbi:radical SAM protein [Candidatus Woesearchaeota archaeon]|nr:radical SAM protein [Candidatus Woesearchaeota archaeon]
MRYAILDCYTDEPAGLGVPPYLGTYPRYLAGALSMQGHEVFYLTIDDLRLFKYYHSRAPQQRMKTNIRIRNISPNFKLIENILGTIHELIVVAGIHVPGKYLSAIPGVLPEIVSLLQDVKCRKVLTGPAGSVHGSRLEGGKHAEKADLSIFDEINENYLEINNYLKVEEYAWRGAFIVKQHPCYPDFLMAEIETGRGCKTATCSFCVEPFKKLQYRPADGVLMEIKALYELGVRNFRYGKQTCFYSYMNGDVAAIEKLLKGARELCPEIKTLHIDNVNPISVVGPKGSEITKLIVEYCTPGNVAAFGVESFDRKVVKENTLNCMPEVAYKAIKIINQYGAEKGYNGMPKFLPGINIIFGLKGESRHTNEENMLWLKRFLDEGLQLRRINIRQVAVLPGTTLGDDPKGGRELRKNKRFYWSWRKQIRKEIDLPMLRKVFPKGTILADIGMEIYDGNHTFGRQPGTYPLVVGVNKRVDLGRFYSVKITEHMLRSVTAEVLA